MKSIAIKLWLGMMTLVAVVLVLLWLFQIVFLNNFYTQMRVNDIKNASVEIIKDMSDLTAVEEKLDIFAYNNNLTAELMDLKSQIIFTTGTSGMNGQMGMMRGPKTAEAYSKIIQGETVLLPMTHPRCGSQFMLIGIPVMDKETVQGALMITLWPCVR